MQASRHVVFFLAFVVLVSAIPLHHHHRRSQCGGVTSLAVSNASTATATTESASRSGSPSPSYSSKPGSFREAKTDTKSSGNNLISSLLEQLLPIANSVASWTTSPSAEALPLDDATFRPTKEIKNLSHNYVNAPDGKKSMQAHYPKGSYNFGNKPQGGFSFYAPGPQHVDLSTAKEAFFGYSVFFPENFDFVKGGKLPGIYGGNSEGEAVSCSDGRRDDGCFSARLMWRSQGDGELYTYLPPSFDENQAVCNVKPESLCNSVYGASVGRGSFKFAAGKRTNISERVRLNDAGKANGELELFVDGKSVINVKGLVLRDSGAGKMRGLQMQTFFGGSTKDYATPKDQDVYFSDFSVAITESL